MSSSGQPGPRVLIVEDEFLIRMTLAEALGDEGFDVVEAETGDAALPILRADPEIRLLLTDIQLPGVLNGKSLAQKAREHLPTLAAAASQPSAPSATPVPQVAAEPTVEEEVPLKLNPIQANERQMLLRLLEQHRWNVSNVAKALAKGGVAAFGCA